MAPGRVCQGEPYLGHQVFWSSAWFGRICSVCSVICGWAAPPKARSLIAGAWGKGIYESDPCFTLFAQSPVFDTSVKIEKAFGSADGLYLFSSESGFWPQWNCFWKRVSWNKEHALQRLLRSIVWLFRQIFEFAFVQVDVTRSDWRMAKDIRWALDEERREKGIALPAVS
jgi:hypothetical protein